MNHIDKKTLGELKDKLLEGKDLLEKELSAFAEKTGEDGKWKARYVDIGSDPGENAQEVTDYETKLPIKRALVTRLNKIEKALARMDEGKYGLCEADEEPIDIKRLMVSPETPTCQEHANS